MSSQFLVEVLLETDAVAPNAALDQLRWRFRKATRFSPFSTDLAGNSVRQLIRDMDASGRSMEGEPDAKQRDIERQNHYKVIPPKSTGGGMYKTSAGMCRGRNERRKSYGYRDTYSMRERGWPTAYRRPDGSERKPRKQKPIPVDEPQI